MKTNFQVIFAAAVIAVALIVGVVPQNQASAQALSKSAAVALAEKFVAENGYTNLPKNQVKAKLDPESFEWGGSRDEVLARRFDSLFPKAIGIKKGGKGEPGGWSVAFEIKASGSESSDSCRVVTMRDDGSNMRVQHVDGIRKFFVGFD